MIDRNTELFLQRVALTMDEQGLGIAEAMQAVCERDRELLNLFSKPDVFGALTASLASAVYTRARGEAAPEVEPTMPAFAYTCVCVHPGGAHEIHCRERNRRAIEAGKEIGGNPKMP